MRKTPLKRKTQLKAKKPLTGSKLARKASKPRKTTKHTYKGYQVPKWFKKIPKGSHGSTPSQKRLWKVVSDTYRKADWEKYGYCVSCKKHIEDWKYGDLAHFKKYSVCHSWFKFRRENLALSCKGCNQRDDGVVGHAFGEELKRRYHKDIIDWIEGCNEAFRGQKMQEWEIVELVADLRPDLVDKNE